VSASDAAAAAWAPLIECLPQPTWIVDAATLGVVAVNGAALALLALPLQAVIGQRADHLMATPEDLAYWDEVRAGVAGRLRSDATLCTADGRTVFVERCIAPLPVAGAAGAGHCVVSLMDRTAQQRAEDEREQVVAELQATLESTADGILVTDLAGRLRAFNRRFAQVWGLPENLLDTRDDAAIQDWMRRSVVDAEAYERRLGAVQQATLLATTERLELHSGQVVERVTRPLWSRGRPHGRVYSFRDITDRIAADQRIEALSLNDALTGLPNRRQLADRVTQAVKRARRDGPGFALLLVDLDRFRQINDSLGHDTGDRVLIDVAQRILGCLRAHDVLARLGGDQFAVLVHDADAPAAEATARRVLNVVAQPCCVDDAQFTLTCSIGVVLCPQHGQGTDELVRHADAALRSVKAAGRANYRVHHTRVEVDLRSHMHLDHAMRQALVSGRFRLHYQPQVRLSDGALVGAEALIRWRDPELGDVSPGRFIPVAEDSGFVVAIGDWVLSQAVRQGALWHESGRPVPIAINVSALQFQQPQFVDRVASVLAVSGLPPHLLELEMTESILVRDADEALQRLHALARLGVRLAIDDFGTGYSSLSYLKRFPIGKLKIDRSFIKGLPDDDSDVGIVSAILQMARALGLKVIAEGVETEVQRQFLQAAGCEEFQGFLYAPALDSLSFEKHLPAPRVAPPRDQSQPRMRLVR
jgi:diguanylate cyclase (GGDEF)-like protein/PAS domain S-box-containing protein